MLNHPFLESELRARHQDLLREAQQRRLMKLAQSSRRLPDMRAWVARLVGIIGQTRPVAPAPPVCPTALELEKMRTLL